MKKILLAIILLFITTPVFAQAVGDTFTFSLGCKSEKITTEIVGTNLISSVFRKHVLQGDCLWIPKSIRAKDDATLTKIVNSTDDFNIWQIEVEGETWYIGIEKTDEEKHKSHKDL